MPLDLNLETDRLLTQEQVCVMLDVSFDTVQRYIKAGRLKPIKVGSRVRITERELRLVRCGGRQVSAFDSMDEFVEHLSRQLAGVKHPPRYASRSQEERNRVADDCLRGVNSGRKWFAEEIRAGDLCDDDGFPKSYWHCLATLPPPVPEGRRGEWKATPAREFEGGHWVWADWGPVLSTQETRHIRYMLKRGRKFLPDWQKDWLKSILRRADINDYQRPTLERIELNFQCNLMVESAAKARLIKAAE